ncbi:hypothetical protein J6590_024416 [Homalodisca vitripennis]|nr:hypothetical protein J6590_024416 [Homalodisca vitripennis]
MSGGEYTRVRNVQNIQPRVFRKYSDSNVFSLWRMTRYGILSSRTPECRSRLFTGISYEMGRDGRQEFLVLRRISLSHAGVQLGRRMRRGDTDGEREEQIKAQKPRSKVNRRRAKKAKVTLSLGGLRGDKHLCNNGSRDLGTTSAGGFSDLDKRTICSDRLLAEDIRDVLQHLGAVEELEQPRNRRVDVEQWRVMDSWRPGSSRRLACVADPNQPIADSRLSVAG